jgi:hypothetical protein
VSREEGLKRKRCQKIGMPRERDVNGQRLKRHGCPETAMTSEKHCQERRVSGLGLHSCKHEGLSKFRDAIGRPDQEKAASSDKDVKRKKDEGERAPRADAVNGRDNQAIMLRSYRHSQFFIRFPLGNYRRPLARALLVSPLSWRILCKKPPIPHWVVASTFVCFFGPFFVCNCPSPGRKTFTS